MALVYPISLDRGSWYRHTKDMYLGAYIVLGLLTGSFLNVLADRLPFGEDVFWGRSHCDHCKKSLRWFELIPVISFLMLRGRCMRCHKKLSILYPLSEVVTAMGFGLFYTTFPDSSTHFFIVLLLFCSFLVIFIADFKYQIIPDSMVIIATVGSLAWVGLTMPVPEALARGVVGVLSGAFFYVIWLVTRGKAMGFGDVKLSVVLGFLLGFPSIVFALYGAFLTGGLVGAILIMARLKTLKSKIAFGPFLLFGTAIAIVFNQELLRLWKFVF